MSSPPPLQTLVTLSLFIHLQFSPVTEMRSINWCAAVCWMDHTQWSILGESEGAKKLTTNTQRRGGHAGGDGTIVSANQQVLSVVPL